MNAMFFSRWPLAGLCLVTFLACNSASNGSSGPSVPVITASDVLTANQTDNTATVPDQDGCTFAWTIQGGVITSAATGNHITFTAGNVGTLTLTCTATNQSGSTSGTKEISVIAEQALAISNVSASSTTPITATISWTTNLAATSLVEYGATTNYGQTSPLDSSLVMSHSVSLTGLTAGTTYHFRVRSRDAQDHEAVGDDGTVTTSASTSAPYLGAHTLEAHGEGSGVNPIITDALTTQASGSTLLAVSLQYNVNDAAPADSYHNTWQVLGSKHIYPTWTSWYHSMWSVTSATGGSDHTLSVDKTGNPPGESSLALIEIVNGGVIKDFAYAWSTSGTPNTTAPVTTDGPAVLIAVWCGDSGAYEMTAIPDNGFEVIDSYLDLNPSSGIQVAIAAKQVTQAGSYTTTWTGEPVQGAGCFLVAVE